MSDWFAVDAWQQVLVSSFSELGGKIAGFLPNLVGMLVILLLGWLVSRVVSSVFGGLLSRAGLDSAADRLGVLQTLERAGLESGPSRLIEGLVFWVLMLTFVLSAVETLGLEAVTGTIDRLIAYLPNVIAASLIVVVGLLLARFTDNLVSSGAATAGIEFARPLGGAAQGVVLLMAGVLAAEQLGVDTTILLNVVTALVAAASLGLALAFALGSREVVGAILAGHYLRQSLREGDEVEVLGRRGRVERIGSVDTLLRDGDGSWSIPNGRLLNETVVR